MALESYCLSKMIQLYSSVLFSYGPASSNGAETRFLVLNVRSLESDKDGVYHHGHAFRGLPVHDVTNRQ